MIAGIFRAVTGLILRCHRDCLAVFMADADHPIVHDDLAAKLLDQVATAFPHHAGSKFGILEFLDQRRDVLLVVLRQERVHHGVGEREILDALRREIRRGAC